MSISYISYINYLNFRSNSHGYTRLLKHLFRYKFVNFVREGEGGPTKTQNLDSGAGPSVMGFWTL